MKFGTPVQNEMPVTMMWSKLKPEFGIRIPTWRMFVYRKWKYVYRSSGLRCIKEIWFADKFWPSEKMMLH